MYGPQGSGKTSIVQQIINLFTKNNGICIFMNDPSLMVQLIRMVRTVEPNRPVLVIMEDIDSIVNRYGDGEILALMDGEMQVDNVLFVATTNYPERLDRRLVCRPSRFDIVRKVGMPSEAARETYLLARSPRFKDLAEKIAKNEECDRSELDEWIKLTKDFSVAHLRELIVSVDVFESTLKESTDRLRSMLKDPPSSGDFEGGFGFTNR
jgi:SpoVK/Ycf46/Vps4 family AAA+-type ATPase